MKNIIIWILGLFLTPLAVAQTAQFGPLYWSASSTGAVQITTATYLAFPAVVDTLNLTITALNTTTAWTVNLYVASSPTGPWTTNCPGGTINGAAITVSAGTTLNLNCKPQGAAFLQIYVTAGTGGGQLVGSIAGTNSSLGSAAGGPFLPLSGGTITGPLSAASTYTASSTPLYNFENLWTGAGGSYISTAFFGCPDMNSSNYCQMQFGVGNAPNQSFAMLFNYIGSGSSSNSGLIDFWGVTQENYYFTASGNNCFDSGSLGTPNCSHPFQVGTLFYSDTSGNVSSNTILSQHYIAGGSAVTIAGTGGSPTCVSSTTCLDYRGRLSIPASTTATTVTFSTAYATSPICTVTQNGGATFFIPAWSSTATALTITTGVTLTTSEEFDYTCVQ